MSKNKPEWLDRDLFVSPFYYTLCTTEKHFKKVLKHLKIKKSDHPSFLKNDHCDATVHWFEATDNKICTVVCINNKEGRKLTTVHGLLVHETVHIWQRVKERVGEHSPSDEFEAYAIQTLAQRLMEEYDRQSKG